MGLMPYKGDPTELPSPVCHMRTQGEVCKLEESPHLAMLAPELRLPASRTGRNKCQSFIRLPVCAILI